MLEKYFYWQRQNWKQNYSDQTCKKVDTFMLGG